MNKGSWRMLQPCMIVAAVHRLHKTKNYQPKGSSHISICEGQVHLAAVLAHGHKKGQRCFICFVPFFFWIQLTSGFFIASFHWGAVPQRGRKGEDLPSQTKTQTRAQLYHPQWEIVPPFSSQAQSETCAHLSVPLADTAPALGHQPPFSWHRMIQTENFRGRKMDSADF